MANHEGVRFHDHEHSQRILTREAQEFLVQLHRRFDGRRRELLSARAERQTRIDAGESLSFPEETRAIRGADWAVAPTPADLQDRRVEITGPCDRKMMINALNSGAKVFMADCEDAQSPSWQNQLTAQVNLSDAVRRTIFVEDTRKGKRYELAKETATLLVRPRGWHLAERHLTVDGEPISGSLFDFGLYFFHNAAELISRGSGPYFYLAKL
jgi:malate synthase